VQCAGTKKEARGIASRHAIRPRYPAVAFLLQSGTEQNIFICQNNHTFFQYIVNTTGGLPVKPCGSSMLAATKKTISKKQYMLNIEKEK